MAKKLAYGEKCGEKALFRNYRAHARIKGMTFSLPLSTFEKLIRSDCFYCGARPTQIRKAHNSVLFYNGIDRLRNESGYTPSNSVPCCTHCNSMKSDMPLDRFLHQINLIAGKMLGVKK